jgi:hypothetical protein
VIAARETLMLRRRWMSRVTQAALLTLLLCTLLADQVPAAHPHPRLAASALVSSISSTAFAPSALPPGNPMLLEVVNTTDHSWPYKWAVRLNVVTTPAPTLQNTLDISTDCGDCRTVGISVQFNVVQRSAGTVASLTDATTATTCTFGPCITMGLVVQYTVIADNPARALPRVERLMRRSIWLLRRMFPHKRVSVTRVLSGFNALARLLLPGTPIIRLSTPASTTSTRAANGPPSIAVALVS